MKILVTGAAGFIGFHVSRNLILQGHEVLGIDNINDYYDVNLKFSRLEECGITKAAIQNRIIINSSKWSNFKFAKIDLESIQDLTQIFNNEKFEIVFHFAAQAGVRYSIDNPRAYINSNIVGFFNILELCKEHNINRFIYASSSSVYGITEKNLFSITDKTDTPASLYAATKKSNELMAHSYSHLFGITTIGLRFFTVYGPWGRPDMAPFIFSKAISENKKINVFNKGKMQRDFTYIDDIVKGIILLSKAKLESSYNIFNIGNSKPIQLLDFIECLEKQFEKKAILEMREMQKGDVISTWADVEDLQSITGYAPETDINDGVKKFVDWYKLYFGIK